jgi:hypothetical protein
MKPVPWLIVLAFTAIGIGAAEVKQLSPLEAARNIWHLCIAIEANRIDDTTSPASDIATALQSTCESAYVRYLDQMTLNQQMRQQFLAQRLATTKEVATTMVLKLRAKRRAPEPKLEPQREPEPAQKHAPAKNEA